MDNPDLGTIILRRVAKEEGSLVSATNLAAPKDARKAFNKGRAALARNELEDAIKGFKTATRIYPRYAAAWQELGKAQMSLQQFNESGRSFESAIKADSRYIEPYLSFSTLLAVQKQWQKLAAITSQAIRLDPHNYPQAYYLNAAANLNTGNISAAETSAREAEDLDGEGRLPQTRELLGMILADRRDFAQAAGQFREYLKLAPQAADASAVRTQLAQVESLAQAQPPQ
jgi:tetratricopeptide (TPR) repeat protein